MRITIWHQIVSICIDTLSACLNLNIAEYEMIPSDDAKTFLTILLPVNGVGASSN